MLIVTGAGGQLGRRVVDHLLERAPAERIGVSARDPGKVADLAARGVRVRHGDFNDAESLRHAFDGAERLLMVSSNAAATGGDPLAQHRTAIDVAAEIGVSRLFYTSQLSCAPDAHFFPGRTHAATEVMLAESGLRWTSLRHGFYSASAVAMFGDDLKAGRFELPEDGKVAWTTHDDLAEADAILLAGDEEIDGPTSVLTARETLDFADLARAAGTALGRPVTREVVSDEAFRARAIERGVPDGAAAFAISYYRAARASEFARTDPLLGQLLGREPETMEAYFERTLGR